METRICKKCNESRNLEEYYTCNKSTCKHCLNSQKKIYRDSNKEKLKEYRAAFKKENSEKLKERRSRYYLNNRDAAMARSTAWRKLNKTDKDREKDRQYKREMVLRKDDVFIRSYIYKLSKGLINKQILEENPEEYLLLKNMIILKINLKQKQEEIRK